MIYTHPEKSKEVLNELYLIRDGVFEEAKNFVGKLEIEKITNIVSDAIIFANKYNSEFQIKVTEHYQNDPESLTIAQTYFNGFSLDFIGKRNLRGEIEQILQEKIRH